MTNTETLKLEALKTDAGALLEVLRTQIEQASPEELTETLDNAVAVINNIIDMRMAAESES
jgi:hypothetical protein